MSVNTLHNNLNPSQEDLHEVKIMAECEGHENIAIRTKCLYDFTNCVPCIKQEFTDDKLLNEYDNKDKESFVFDERLKRSAANKSGCEGRSISKRFKDKRLTHSNDKDDQGVFYSKEEMSKCFTGYDNSKCDKCVKSDDDRYVIEINKRDEMMNRKYGIETIDNSTAQFDKRNLYHYDESCNECVSLHQDHVTTQNTKKPFVCHFVGCTKSFCQRSDLTRHCRVHTGEKPYICPFDGCNQSFTQLSSLSTHSSIHMGYKPFICSFEGCNKSFSRQSVIEAHLRTHTGERPYVCTFDGCDKAFGHRKSLYRHSKLHTGEKPHTCPVDGCNKAFSDKGNLLRHSKTHSK